MSNQESKTAPQPPSVGDEVELPEFDEPAYHATGSPNWHSANGYNSGLEACKPIISARDQQLAELKQAFMESQEEVVSRGKQLAAQAKENEALRARVAELEELRKDAERYRWLCDGNGYFMEENSLCGHDNDKEEADAEIDAAMAKQVTKDDQ